MDCKELIEEMSLESSKEMSLGVPKTSSKEIPYHSKPVRPVVEFSMGELELQQKEPEWEY